MSLTENYIECYKRFYRYIISNEIIKDLNEQEFYLILQNNLRESLGKSKMSSNVCNAIIKTGKRKGEECGKPVKDGCEKCKTHSKKNEEDIVPSYISKAKEEEDILLIKKNIFNNFVYFLGHLQTPPLCARIASLLLLIPSDLSAVKITFAE